MENGDLQSRNARKPNPIDIHVGSRVRFRRMLLGMSQEKLGDRLGLTFQQVQKYEKGVNRIGASRLFELTGVLGVNVQFFYDDAPDVGHASNLTGMAEEPKCDYVGGFLKSGEGIELNRAFAKISDPKVRRSVVDLVRSLADDDSVEPSVQPPQQRSA